MSEALAPLEVQESDLLEISSAFLKGESADNIAERLGYATEDVISLLGRPDTFDLAIKSKQQLLQLMLLGPIADKLVDLAMEGVSQVSVQATKLLKSMVDETPKGRPPNRKPDEPIENNTTFNVLFAEGGYDAIVRGLSGVKDITPNGD